MLVNILVIILVNIQVNIQDPLSVYERDGGGCMFPFFQSMRGTSPSSQHTQETKETQETQETSQNQEPPKTRH